MVINDINLNALEGFGKRISLDEGTLLLREGDFAKNVYFIIAGAARLFFLTEDGSEVTLEFFFEKSFVASFSSFNSELPSNYCLETIEKSEFLKISKENIGRVYLEYPELHTLYLSGLEKRLSDYIGRLRTLLSLDAKNKYLELMKKRPDVVQRVKQKYIASYLGIKPESLSRIRSNL